MALFGGFVASKGFVTTEGSIRSCGATIVMSMTTGCCPSKGEGLLNEPKAQYMSSSGKKG